MQRVRTASRVPSPAPRPTPPSRPEAPALAPPVLLQRALRGGPLRPAEVIALQRAVGNRAVGRLLSGTDGGAVQRVIHNGKSVRAAAFEKIRSSGIYKKAALVPGGQDLVVAMHASDTAFGIPDVVEALKQDPLPSIGDLEAAKGAAKKKNKPNAIAKSRHKAKSNKMRNLGVGRTIPIKSKTWKGSKPRRIEQQNLARGGRLTLLSKLLVKKTADRNPLLKSLLEHVKKAEDDKLKRHQAEIQSRTVVTNVQDQVVAGPSDYLAHTHVTLRNTDGRSSYASFVRPDPGQKHGAFHPLHNPGDTSLRVLNGVELLRNDGSFALSLLLKSAALQQGTITIKEAVNPSKYGTAELSEVSGKSRDEFSNAISANTDLIFQERVVSKDPFAQQVEMLLEKEDKGEDTSSTMDVVETEFEKLVKQLTGTK